MLKRILLFLLFTSAAIPQTATLENWATLRQNHSSSWSLWTSFAGSNQCLNQGTLTVSGGKATTFITACAIQIDPTHCDLTPGNNSCLYTELNSDLSSGYTFDQGFMQSYLTSGTWSPLFNKLEFTLSCTTDWPASEGQFGTYIKDPAVDPPGFDQGAQHYYNQMFLNAYANRDMKIQIGWAVTHRVGFNSINWPKDPSFVLPPDGYHSLHYWDYMSHFYIDPWYTTGATTNRSCSYGPLTFITTTSFNEPEEYNKDLSITYDGSKYELNWYGAKSVTNNWEVRYSSSQSLHTLGFSNGTSGASGTFSGPLSGSFYYMWQSTNTAQTPNMWIGVRPIPVVEAATNTSPILISTVIDTGLATGDQVTISGVGGTTAANNTWTVTSIPRQYWRGNDGTLTGFVVSAAAGINNVLITTSTAHGLQIGQTITCDEFQGPDMCTYGSTFPVKTVPTSTTFTVSSPGTSDGNYLTGAGGDYMKLWSNPVLSLNGSTGNGAYTSGGTIQFLSNTTNFTEIMLSASGSTTGGTTRTGKTTATGKVVH